MSGTNYTTICPECEKETLMCYSDRKPYDLVEGTCVNCGFYYYVREGKLTERHLKIEQEERGYNPKTGEFEDD